MRVGRGRGPSRQRWEGEGTPPHAQVALATYPASGRGNAGAEAHWLLASDFWLLQRDPAVDLMGEIELLDGQDHMGLELGLALEFSVRQRLPHRLLDLALRGDPDLLEEFAQLHVEHVFVH